MLGLDDWIAGLSQGGSAAVVVLVAALLGLRHAADPDHIAAVSTLVASGRERATGAAARLGAWWGAGHALTLLVFGAPILLADRFLPEALQRGAETGVALLIVFLAVTHFAAPGVVSHVYKRFDPKGGLVKQQQTRAGQRGSGRLADLGPGLRRFEQSPLFGYGLGTVAARGEIAAAARDTPQESVSIIFDNQYMNTLVTLGACGFLGVVWFAWGAFLKVGRMAKRGRDGPGAGLMSACAIACAGFSIGLLTFDAFSFVQSTLMFFLIAALGLTARRLVRE